MKIAIAYYSKHHSNTKQILDAIKSASSDEITLIDVTNLPSVELSSYDAIGFASGIYYSKFHKSLLKFAQENLPNGKDVFFIYTYGAKKDGYTKAIRQAISSKDANVLGEYGCFGFNTFGPFKFIGGIAKGHPDDADKKGAVEFYEGLFR